jgi:peptide/nickel transport system substrate-binding protein
MLYGNLSRRKFLRGASAAGLATVAGPRLGWSASGGTLTVSTYGDLQVLDPAFHLSAPETAMSELIYQHLIVFKGGQDTDWELEAAESIEQIDDTHIKFTLKPGIMWNDDLGEVTAEDVKFSFERIIDPEMQSPYAGDWGTLDHVEVIDKYSGVIVLKEYMATLWTIALPNNAGMIVSKKAVEALPGKKFTTNPPCYCGPYRIKQWVPKQRVVFERNPNWTGAPQHWDEIVIIPIEDPAAEELAYEAGDLDFSRLTLATLARYREEGPPPNSKIIDIPSIAYVWMGMNIENPALQDIRVRKAIQLAVDADTAVEAAYFGIAERATGIIAPSLIGHREKNLVSRDVEAAKALLREAGAEGLTLTLDTQTNTEYVTMAQVVQASLAEAGINVVIQPRDSGTFWTLGDESAGDQWKDIQLIIGRFTMSPDPSYATEWFTCNQVGVWNWERFCNEEFDRLHDAAKREKDEAKRAAMYRRMQDLMEESGAYVFLTHERDAFIHRATIDAVLRPDGDPLYLKFKPTSA